MEQEGDSNINSVENQNVHLKNRMINSSFIKLPKALQPPDRNVNFNNILKN